METVCKIGYNDTSFTVSKKVNGQWKRSIIYDRWYGMLDRIVNKYNNPENDSYKDITICDEWLYYSNFHSWVKDYKYNIKNLSLDKDILIPNNKVYSPNTCIFVDIEINNMFRKTHITKKSGLPLGVSKHGKKYRADYRHKYLGQSSDISICEQLYKNARAEHIEQIAEQQQDILVITGLLRHADLLRYGEYNF